MRASAAASFKKVSQALHESPALPCAVLLGKSTVRGTLRRALGGGSSNDTGAVEAEALDGICLVDCPDPQSAEAATELATFLRALRRTNGFILACEDSEENVPLETLMLLMGFYGISEPWPHLAIAMSAAPSKGNEASKREVTLKRRLRCDSATFGGGKVQPPGKLSVFLLGGSEGSGKGSKNDEIGRLKEFLKKCKPLKCDPIQSMSPLLTQYRSITQKLANQRTIQSSPRRPPAPGQRLLALSKSKSPDEFMPVSSANGARLASAGSRSRLWEGKPMDFGNMLSKIYGKPRSFSAGGSMRKSASDGNVTPPGSRQWGPHNGQDVSRHRPHFGVGAPRLWSAPSSRRRVDPPYLSATAPNHRWANAESDFSGSDRFRHHGYGWSDGGYDRSWERWNDQHHQQSKRQLSQTYHNERWYDGGWSGWHDAGWSSDDNWQHSGWKDDSAWNKEQQPEDTSKCSGDPSPDWLQNMAASHSQVAYKTGSGKQ